MKSSISQIVKEAMSGMTKQEEAAWAAGVEIGAASVWPLVGLQSIMGNDARKKIEERAEAFLATKASANE